MIEEVEFPPALLFVGHEYAQHASRDGREDPSIQYSSYLNSKSYGLATLIASAYESSTALGSEKIAVS